MPSHETALFQFYDFFSTGVCLLIIIYFIFSVGNCEEMQTASVFKTVTRQRVMIVHVLTTCSLQFLLSLFATQYVQPWKLDDIRARPVEWDQ